VPWSTARTKEGHAASEGRTNTEAHYTIGKLDLVIATIRERLAAATCSPSSQFEVAKLLHYEPGQQFALRADYQYGNVATPARSAHRR
jgi:hypothetical protein